MTSSNKNIVTKLSENFPEATISHHEVIISHTVHVLIIKVQNEELLNSLWKRIRDYIAVYFQTTMESEFERWNLYLIYVSEKIISKELKYKIENDRISSRKIVVDHFMEEFNDKSISAIIKKYIDYTFLLPDEDMESYDSYISKSIIYRLVSEKITSSFKNRDREIERLYSKIKDELS